MSVQALSAVFDLPGAATSPSQRLVLLSIANHANRYGLEAYPGWQTITEETGLSRATVARCISELRRAGVLRVEKAQKRGGDGRFSVTVYGLELPGLATPPESQNETPTGSHHETAPGLKPSLKPGLIDDDRNHIDKEPSREQSAPSLIACSDDDHDPIRIGPDAFRCGRCGRSLEVASA